MIKKTIDTPVIFSLIYLMFIVNFNALLRLPSHMDLASLVVGLSVNQHFITDSSFFTLLLHLSIPFLIIRYVRRRGGRTKEFFLVFVVFQCLIIMCMSLILFGLLWVRPERVWNSYLPSNFVFLQSAWSDTIFASSIVFARLSLLLVIPKKKRQVSEVLDEQV